MPLFDIIFVALFVAAWMTLGLLPWTAASVFTRGNAGVPMLPVCIAAAVLAGLMVPFLGMTGAGGIWVSMLAALVLPSLLLVARRFKLSTAQAHREQHASSHGKAE